MGSLRSDAFVSNFAGTGKYETNKAGEKLRIPTWELNETERIERWHAQYLYSFALSVLTRARADDMEFRGI